MMITLGMTFDITEHNIKDMLMARMKRFDIEKAQDAIKERIKHTARHPKAIFQNARCHRHRLWFYDPTVTLDRDVIDRKGTILIRKGSTYNPLHHRTVTTQLLFIEGHDPAQVSWALKQPKAKIILVNGPPLDLEEHYQVPLYFDQGGHLCRKFGIAAFPATVCHTKAVRDKLTCEEIEVLA